MKMFCQYLVLLVGIGRCIWNVLGLAFKFKRIISINKV